nr:L10-interacting MYB domain-containing protein-like [Ipomoea trifida]
MDTDPNEQQPKQERLRTRWTPSLDKIFADLVVEQIRLGNRPNNVFDKKTWNYIRGEFNKQTNLDFNNNQLRKHLDVLRTRYYAFKSASGQNDPLVDCCFVGFDLWEDIAAQPKPETTKIKECPIYDELCLIFADSGADGKYAQSSHYGELEKSAGVDPSFTEIQNPCPKAPLPSTISQGNETSPKATAKSTVEKKRKRLSEAVPDSGENSRDTNMINIISETLQEMIAASKLRLVGGPQIDKRFTISKCIKALDEIEGMHDALYYAALDLFEDPNLRETFLSLNDSMRLTWLQGNFGNPVSDSLMGL